MAGSRTLKLSILADVDDLKKKLSDGSKDVESFGDKLGSFGKKAAAAFAVAAAAAATYAVKLGIDGVKAAIEDAAAQDKLAGVLTRVAGASENTIAAVEKYITKTAIATGVADDQLRPALSRLLLSTQDAAKAQELLNLALDISVATSKPLEAVANALGKAYDGNSKALQKLGIDVTTETTVIKDNTAAKQAAERAQLAYNQAVEKYGANSQQAETALLKLNQAQEKLATNTTVTKNSVADLNTLLPELQAKFGGAAADNAETFAGKMERLKIAFEEGKETVGSFILDAITPLATFMVDRVIPAVSEFADKMGEKLKPIFEDTKKTVVEKLLPALKDLGNFLKEALTPTFEVQSIVIKKALDGIKTGFDFVKDSIGRNKETFKDFYETVKPIVEWIGSKVAPVIGGVLAGAFKVLGAAIGIIIDGFALVAKSITAAIDGIAKLINTIKNNPIVSGISGLIDKAFGGGKAIGGSVNANTSYLVGESGAELFVPSTSGKIIPNNMLGGNTINLNVTGAIDPEGTARTIIQALNDSFARGTLGSLAFRS